MSGMNLQLRCQLKYGRDSSVSSHVLQLPDVPQQVPYLG